MLRLHVLLRGKKNTAVTLLAPSSIPSGQREMKAVVTNRSDTGPLITRVSSSHTWPPPTGASCCLWTRLRPSAALAPDRSEQCTEYCSAVMMERTQKP